MRNALLAVLLVIGRRAVAGESDVFYAPGKVQGAFLCRGAGARAAGMGSAFTAVADDASAVSWNPGGLGNARTLSSMLMYDSVADSINLGYASLISPVGEGMAAGIALAWLDYGSYTVRDSEGVVSGEASLSDVAVTAGWSFPNPRMMGGTGWTGVGAEFLHSGVGGSAGALNLGSVVKVSYRTTIGWALLHAGPKSNGFSLPATIRAGISHGEPGRYRLALDFGYGLADRQSRIAVGGEAYPYPYLAVRCGYSRPLVDQGLEGITGLSLGLGAGMRGWGLSYAFIPFSGLAMNHRVSLTYTRPIPVEAQNE